MFYVVVKHTKMAHPQYQNQIRRMSQLALERLRTVPRQRLFWKCDEEDPRKHTEAHLGLFYQLPDEKKLVQIYGYACPFNMHTIPTYKTWGQIPIMVRQPALSVMDHLRKSNQPGQSTKVLLHGDPGQGKWHTLLHLVHFLQSNKDHFTVQIGTIKRFTRNPREFTASTSRDGRVDTPLDAALLLQQLRTTNADLFEKFKDTLVCSQDYKWSIRETTAAGEPLTRIAEHGVNRVNHASDCVAVLLKELMLAADQGKIKLATTVNDLMWLYKYEASTLKHADFRRILVDEITVARAIKKLVSNTGKNAVLVATCHDTTTRLQNLPPQEILGDEAMADIEGCTQIHVPKYSKQEFENCMNFYQDIGWLARPEARTQEARDELRFISGSNPKELEYLCRSI